MAGQRLALRQAAPPHSPRAPDGPGDAPRRRHCAGGAGGAHRRQRGHPGPAAAPAAPAPRAPAPAPRPGPPPAARPGPPAHLGEWPGACPGALQGDLVLHCGASTAGFYCATLVAVDVATSWIELQATLGPAPAARHRRHPASPRSAYPLRCVNGTATMAASSSITACSGGVSATPSLSPAAAPIARTTRPGSSNAMASSCAASSGTIASVPAPPARCSLRLYHLLRLQHNFFRPVRKLSHQAPPRAARSSSATMPLRRPTNGCSPQASSPPRSGSVSRTSFTRLTPSPPPATIQQTLVVTSGPRRLKPCEARRAPRAEKSRLVTMRFAVDTGGTFTDLVVEDDDGRLHMYKAPTTPERPGRRRAGRLRARRRGARASTRARSWRRGDLFIHGTTHRDQRRPHRRTAQDGLSHHSRASRHPGLPGSGAHGASHVRLRRPLPRAVCPARADVRGAGADRRRRPRAHPLDEGAVLALIAGARGGGRRGGRRVPPVVHRQPTRTSGGSASCSPSACPACRHACRTPSTRRSGSTGAPRPPCIDASLKPLMGEYLEELSARLRDAGFGGRRDGRDLAGRRDGGRRRRPRADPRDQFRPGHGAGGRPRLRLADERRRHRHRGRRRRHDLRREPRPPRRASPGRARRGSARRTAAT